MPWSLVETLAASGQPRSFHLPLWSDASGLAVGQDQYDPENDRTTDPNDPRLRIVISPPQNGQFTNEGALPDPTIRLYAIGAAWVRFKPAQGAYRDSLELKLAVFASFPLRKAAVGGHSFPLWWERWMEKGSVCIPDRVIYENVDATILRETLENVKAPIDDKFENRVLPTDGLQFPISVTQTTRSEFIDNFMAGDADYFMVAETGAYLGAAARETPTSTDPNANRLLTLHAQYHDHTQISPHPMNPLELFNLLFANDSIEATTHPLLLRIDAKGKAQTGHESKSMRLRPPLRTHARLMWEADLETVSEHDHKSNIANAESNYKSWAPESNVQARFYNDFQGIDELGTPRHFDRWTYDKCKDEHGNLTVCYKCNLFVFDVALRAGFRVMVHPIGNSVWHYREPNGVVLKISESYVNAGSQPLPKLPIRLKVRNAKKTEPLAWNIEGMLRALNSGEIKTELNRQMTEEGRCFVVAGSRVDNSGHMVLVESVSDDDGIYNLTLAPSAGHGFSVLSIQTRGATTHGAERRESAFVADSSNYAAVHLFELHPGKDPDTQVGLQDCNGAVYS
jgi:hypothetical protein